MKGLLVISILVFGNTAARRSSFNVENYEDDSNSENIPEDYLAYPQLEDNENDEDVWLQNENKNRIIQYHNNIYYDEDVEKNHGWDDDNDYYYDDDQNEMREVESRQIRERESLCDEVSESVNTKNFIKDQIKHNHVDWDKTEVRPASFHDITCQPFNKMSRPHHKKYYFRSQNCTASMKELQFYVFIRFKFLNNDTMSNCWHPEKFKIHVGCGHR